MADPNEALGFNKVRFEEGVRIVDDARVDLEEYPLEPVQTQAVQRFIASQLIPFLESPVLEEMAPESRIIVAEILGRVALGVSLSQSSVDAPVTRLDEYAGLRGVGSLGTVSELEQARTRLSHFPREFKGQK